GKEDGLEAQLQVPQVWQGNHFGQGSEFLQAFPHPHGLVQVHLVADGIRKSERVCEIGGGPGRTVGDANGGWTRCATAANKSSIDFISALMHVSERPPTRHLASLDGDLPRKGGGV